MVICNSLSDVPKISQSVLTIGSFDGIHSGHIEILKKMKSLRPSNASLLAVITFSPHPKELLSQNLLDQYLITSFDRKVEIFKSHGIDFLLILPFDKELATIDANVFLEDIIIKYFKPNAIVVGYDHHFGYNRSGNIDLLRYYSIENLYKVHVVDQITIDGMPVSSSKIRSLLISNDIDHANRLLGWNYELKGIVEEGDGLGKAIGYPTANIKPLEPRQIIPSNGVYNVNILFGGALFNGMCNIGHQPTVNGTVNRVEVNIFSNKDLNLYSKEVTVIFKERLRDVKRFSSIDKLKSQLAKDKISCLELNRKIKGEKACQ